MSRNLGRAITTASPPDPPAVPALARRVNVVDVTIAVLLVIVVGSLVAAAATPATRIQHAMLLAMPMGGLLSLLCFSLFTFNSDDLLVALVPLATPTGVFTLVHTTAVGFWPALGLSLTGLTAAAALVAAVRSQMRLHDRRQGR